MFKALRIDNTGKPVYTVDEVDNWNKFTEWLYRLEEEEMTLILPENIYRFRSTSERLQFIFGFMKAWDVIDDTYLKKCHGDM